MIVLHELVPDPRLRELALLIRLKEEASVVAAHLGLDEEQALEPGRPDPDAQRSRSWSASRSPVSGTRTWVISSRERTVAAWSFAVSKSMVTA
jgi:hypothetical protein